VGLLIVAVAIGSPVHTSDRNCSDFANQSRAQDYFISLGGPSSDPDRLDADHDGVACQSLPCPCRAGKPPIVEPPTGRGPALFKGRCARGRLPDYHCTPGTSFSTVTARQVCTPGYSKGVRDVSEALKRKVYLAYGIRRHAPGAYEVDHLVSLELGGNNSQRNLWPERQPGARGKDRLENSLHARLCAGDISLRKAEAEIRHWTAYN
jgi:hypothetical protein